MKQWIMRRADAWLEAHDRGDPNMPDHPPSPFLAHCEQTFHRDPWLTFPDIAERLAEDRDEYRHLSGAAVKGWLRAHRVPATTRDGQPGVTRADIRRIRSTP